MAKNDFRLNGIKPVYVGNIRGKTCLPIHLMLKEIQRKIDNKIPFTIVLPMEMPEKNNIAACAKPPFL